MNELTEGREGCLVANIAQSNGVSALVERQTERTPDAIAVEFGAETLTYRELGVRANRLAHRLIDLGVGRDKIVGICLERSINQIVALLAVFKAGGAYMYLDPAYPAERLGLMVADAQPVVILTRTGLASKLPWQPGPKMLSVDAGSTPDLDGSADAPDVTISPADLGYVIYTSGSTGRPKGVAMPQGPLCNLIEWQLRNWTLPAAARTIQFTSVNFDVAFQEIFATLAAGGSLALISEETRFDFPGILRLMRDRGVERIFLPFVALQALAKAFEFNPILPTALRDVTTAGEQLQVTGQIRAFFEKLPGCALHNQYGPAETHVVTALTLRGSPASWPLLPPIGKAISNCQIYILDERGERVADGSTGEICIGGDVLARGYLNRLDLTSERFVPDPFSSEPGARYYKTGDVGRLLGDGNIEFLGRSDHQVKVRGVRVELGEVEAVLAQHPAVFQAVVCARQLAVGENSLISYFTLSAPVEREELRAFLASRLPVQMVPTSYVPLRSIPLTSTGKVDRITLAALDSTSPLLLPGGLSGDSGLPGARNTSHLKVVPAVDPTQMRLVEMWERLLGVSPIGIKDDFFELGGHSLVAAEFMAQVERNFGRKVPLGEAFKAPTIEQFARILGRIEPDAGWPMIEEIRSTGLRPPFFCVPGFLDLSRHLGPDQPCYGVHLSALETTPATGNAVRDFAARCVAEMRVIQPAGPYYVGGHSFGGVVAFEIAQQLRAAGEDVARLILIDPDAPRPIETNSVAYKANRYLFHVRKLLAVPAGQRIDYLKQRLAIVRGRMSSSVRKLKGDDDAMDRYDAAARGYFPVEYDSPVTMFLARDTPLRALGGDDPRMGWKELVRPGIEITDLPGDHYTLIREPNVLRLAGCITGALCPEQAAVEVPG
jgi:amino acid adenylation domain-containing protein